LKNLAHVHWNLSVPALYEEAVRRREGSIADGGAFVVRTGVHTGRSPKDKFFVEDAQTKPRIDWGATNKAMTSERYRALYNRMTAYAQRRELFVRNMSLRPRPDELEGFKPDFTVLNLPGFQAEPASDGTASDCAVLVNYT